MVEIMISMERRLEIMISMERRLRFLFFPIGRSNFIVK